MKLEGVKKVFNEVSTGDRPDLMTPGEYAEALQAIAADYLDGRPAQENPQALYVTGLFGAGKSTLVRKITAEHPSERLRKALVVNFDDLRVYHPRYQELVRQDPVNAAARTNTAVAYMMQKLLDACAERKIDVIREGAAMGAEITQADMKPFQAAGYRIDAMILTVPAEVSQQSVHLRFEEESAALRNGGTGSPRWVETAQQEKAVAALIETMESLEGGKIARTITIINRDYNTVYAGVQLAGDTLASKMIRHEVERPLTGPEQALFDKNAARIETLMQERLAHEKAKLSKPAARPLADLQAQGATA